VPEGTGDRVKEATLSGVRNVSFTILVALFLSAQILSDERKTSSESSRVDTGPNVLWRDPGLIERLDLTGGPGGKANVPRGPYTFIKEIESGKKPKLKVRDARGSMWSVKWGDEVKAEIFASRLAWVSGYFTLPTYFVESGRIEGATELGRAADQLASDGSFTTARFQAWEPNLLKGRNWAWNYNPFLGSKPFQGLKIITMLTSNWDSKDARDVDMGTNTAIIDYRRPERREFRYLVLDWGGTMGRWGLPGFVRNKWDCDGYASQTSEFVKGVKDGEVVWGFSGAFNEKDINEGITPQDVRWILQYIGKLTDAQIRSGLQASGATPQEVDCFSRSVRERIDQLRKVAQ
jgi:hypothetical protein